ncbi:MetQ/NlpA family ABC transporter substrate-binding protein [Clostridium cagae]|uniref:MetQ/NlpA family ABC transporter substrate-binding protein n=1 Tax=Clostridium cagae TaxID=2080751 RepID=UPI003F75FC29
MKKKSILSTILAGVLIFSLAGCGSTNNGVESYNKDDKTIKIGVTPIPHKEIAEIAKSILEKEGYKLEIIEFTDYVQPNIALAEGDLDANYFQHIPYLNELADGATIAIPNDPSNEARALKLLASKGIIKVSDGELITPKDITENNKNLKFNELEAASIPRVLDDSEAAVINGNYAIPAGFDPLSDPIINEDKNSEAAKPYANITVVKKGDEEKEKIKALTAAFTSPEVREFIEKEYNGAVIPVF